MRILIAGASGFLGSHLVPELTAHGHEVTRLVRRPAGPGEATWDPYGETVDPELIESTDLVVNLAGSPNVGNPYSKAWANRLRESRVKTTRVLAEAIAQSTRTPAFLAGNGISVYGDHGDQLLPESADSRGDAFLTGVTREWEAASRPAAEAGARVVVLRTAPIMDRTAPPLRQMRILFKLGLGGRLGSGLQYFPVVSLRDWISAVRFLAEHEELSGPVNLCCPTVPTNAEFTRTLAELLHRPAVLPVPAFALKLATGPIAPEVLGSIRGVPEALLEAGFEFADPDIEAVLRAGLAARRTLEG